MCSKSLKRQAGRQAGGNSKAGNSKKLEKEIGQLNKSDRKNRQQFSTTKEKKRKERKRKGGGGRERERERHGEKGFEHFKSFFVEF